MRRLALAALVSLAACGGGEPERRATPSWGALSGTTPIARLDGETIVLDDVGPDLALQVYQQQLDTWALLKRETERLVEERLLTREAARQQVSVDELIAREPGATPSEADVDRYLSEHPDTAALPEARAVARRYLAETGRLERRTALVERLKEQARIEFLVEPPVEPRVRLDVTDAPVRGPADAPVTIVHFASFGSPLSARSAAQLARLATEFPNRLRFAHRVFLGEDDALGLEAAALALAAEGAGRFWEAHDRLFALEGQLDTEALDQIAADLEVERPAPPTPAAQARVRRDAEAGRRAGVKQEPTIFVNGRYLAGTLPYEDLRRTVAEELATRRGPA